jgi:CAAX protease family protein
LGPNSKNIILVRQLIYLALLIIFVGASVVIIGKFSPQIGTKSGPPLKPDTLHQLIAVTLIVFTTLAGLYIASRFFADYSWQKKDFYVFRDSITLSDFLICFLVFLASSVIISFVTDKLMNESRAMAAAILFQPAVYIVMLLILFRSLRTRGFDPLFEIGLRSGRLARQLKIGLAAFLFHRPISVIFVAISLIACDLLNAPPAQNPIVDIIVSEPVGWVKVCLVMVPVISAPFFEEIFFRGVLFKVLRNYLSAPLTIVFTALLFAAVHAGLYQGINIFALGLVLGYLVEKTGSIIPSIILHFLINITAILALLMNLV